MTPRQKKFVETWSALGILLLVVVVFHDTTWDVRWAFLPFGLYYLWNWPFLSELAPLNKRCLGSSLHDRKIRVWVYLSSSLIILAALISLLSGFNPVEHLGIGSVLLPVSLPILPALVTSQIAVYKELG